MLQYFLVILFLQRHSLRPVLTHAETMTKASGCYRITAACFLYGKAGGAKIQLFTNLSATEDNAVNRYGFYIAGSVMGRLSHFLHRILKAEHRMKILL